MVWTGAFCHHVLVNDSVHGNKGNLPLTGSACPDFLSSAVYCCTLQERVGAASVKTPRIPHPVGLQCAVSAQLNISEIVCRKIFFSFFLFFFFYATVLFISLAVRAV